MACDRCSCTFRYSTKRSRHVGFVARVPQSMLFCVEHRRVGERQQFAVRFGMVRAERVAHADAQGELRFVQYVSLRQYLADMRGDRLGLVLVAKLRVDDAEFISAEARRRTGLQTPALKRAAISTSVLSPTGWPSVSLISSNPSISSRKSAIRSDPARDCATSSLSLS